MQTPAPPPLPPSADPNLIASQVQETVMMVLLLIAFTVVALKVFGPLARALARKLEGKVGDPELRAEVDQLRDQLGEMDGLQLRVQELEERVEFAERLLSQSRSANLPGGSGGA